MATTYSVDLQFSAKTQQLDAAYSKLTAFDRSADKLKGKNPFEGADRGARSATSQTDALGRSLGGVDRAARSAKGGLSALESILTGGAIAAAASNFTQFASSVLKTGAKFEQLTLSIKAFTGSAEVATTTLNQFKKIGIDSPFSTEQIASAGKALLAFGFNAGDTVEMVRRLSTVAGATGADLNNLAVNLGQIRTQGVATSVDLKQFALAGIPIWQALADVTGKNVDVLKDYVSDGKLGYAEVEAALRKLTGANSGFARLAAEQAGSLTGVWETFQSALQETATVITRAVQPALVKLLTYASEALFKTAKDLNDVVTGLFEVARACKPAIDGFNKIYAAGDRIASLIPGIGGVGNAIRFIGTQANVIIGPLTQVLGLLQAIGNAKNNTPAAYLSSIGGKAASKEKLQTELGNLQAQKAKSQKLANSYSDWNPFDSNKKLEALRAVKIANDRAYAIQQALPGARTQAQIDASKAKQAAPSLLSGGDAAGGGAAKGGGGGGNKEKEAKDRSAELADLQGNVQLKRQQLQLDQQIQAAQLSKNKSAEFDAEFQKRYLEGQAQIAEITRNEADEKIRAAKIEESRLDTMASLRELTFGQQKEYQDQLETFDELLSGAKDQIALAGALTDAQRRSIELEQKLTQLRKDNPWMTDEQLNKLRAANAELDKAVKKAEQMKAQQQQLDDLYGGIANQIASGVGGAIDAVTSSTENLGEALQGLASDILKAVGKMMIFYALAQAFGALGGNDGVGVFSYLAKAFGGGRASGGPVEPNASYIVGEKGPELLTLNSSGGYVHSNSSPAAQEAMARYSPARAGRAGTSQDGSAGGSGAGGGVIRFESTVINGVEYVTRQEAEAIGHRAAMQGAQQGAAGGHAKVMGDLRNKRSVRSRLAL